MPQRYVDVILKYLANRDYQPLKPRQLARQMGVAEEDYGTFRQAVKRLRDAGRVVMGARDALTLPEISKRVVGIYRPNPKGFGFVVPETPNAHGDLFIPPGSDGGAFTGDRVVARVRKRGRRDGQPMLGGDIVEILQRGQNRFVGTLRKSEGTWFVMPDGRQFTTPIVVRDVAAAKAGTKVVAEIVKYGSRGNLPTGVIVEKLGPAGPTEVETRAVIRAHGLAEEFPPEALADARAAIEAFDPTDARGRQDLTAMTVITIDPDDARDFDDAISLTHKKGGHVVLGVHIADVSHFVREGTALDAEARSRATSVYFARKVLPMLPEVLSNGVCSLQEGQLRFCKSAFITYDAKANVVSTRVAETVIQSTKRLTYTQAQDICDHKTGGYDSKVVRLIRGMEKLARAIEVRRRKAGMIHLDLPEVQLIFDEKDRVIDALPEDTAYTHTIIEMFMVEANEAVAALMVRLKRPCIRRVHPAPDPLAKGKVAGFVRAAGHKLPRDLTRQDMQRVIESVRGRPESYAVNLAVLKMFQQAEYSPIQIGHYALASTHYCHFTSPIRRYPDLTVHRLIAEHCRGRLKNRPPEDMSALVELASHCTAAARRAEAAENELREVLVLQFLAQRVGDRIEGVITGVANFGLFVQSQRFLIEGLVRMADLGDDWWEVDARRGTVRGSSSGKTYRIGDILPVRIAGVDLAKRQLNLVPDRDLKQAKTAKKPKKPKKAKQAETPPKKRKRRK